MHFSQCYNKFLRCGDQNYTVFQMRLHYRFIWRHHDIGWFVFSFLPNNPQHNVCLFIAVTHWIKIFSELSPWLQNLFPGHRQFGSYLHVFIVGIFDSNMHFFALVHSEPHLPHWCPLVSLSLWRASQSSLVFTALNNSVSSVNLVISLLSFNSKLLMNKLKSTGVRTKPCDIPPLTTYYENCPFILTVINQFLIHVDLSSCIMTAMFT